MTPDVTVLVAASRGDHPHHALAREWLEQAVSAAGAGATFTLMPMVLTSFLRLVTSSKVFQQPTPIDAAVAFVDTLLAAPGVQLASLGSGWQRLRNLCLSMQLAGNDLPDAWLAAATSHRGEHLVSFDRDFKKLLGRSEFTWLDAGGRAHAAAARARKSGI